MRKIFCMIVALGCALACLVGCGTEKNETSVKESDRESIPSESAVDGGETSGDDGGTGDEGKTEVPVLGEQVTQEEWDEAFQTALEATNVTLMITQVSEFAEEGCIWKENSVSTVKIADGKVYRYDNSYYRNEYDDVSYVEEGREYVVDGDTIYTEEREIEEEYIGMVGDTLYSWSKSSEETEWAKYEEQFMDKTNYATGYGVYFERMNASLEVCKAWYVNAVFDAETGVYSVYVEDEYDPRTLKIEIRNGKVYSVTTIFEIEEEEGADEWGSNTETCVFSDYGATEVGELPKVTA